MLNSFATFLIRKGQSQNQIGEVLRSGGAKVSVGRLFGEISGVLRKLDQLHRHSARIKTVMENKAPSTPRFLAAIPLLLLAPLALLLLRWSRLPASVPVHFSSNGADSYADKRFLFVYVLLPAVLYYAAPYVARNNRNQPFVTAVALFLSFVLCVMILFAGT